MKNKLNAHVAVLAASPKRSILREFLIDLGGTQSGIRGMYVYVDAT